jgi:hypothetical protein
MPTLPAELLPLIVTFAPLFSKPVWESAQVLLAGAILDLGKRTVTACSRVTGKSQESHFQNYHRVLNRARSLGAPSRPDSAAEADYDLCPERLTGGRHRRHDRTSARRKDQSQGHLPQPGSFLALAFRQGERPALPCAVCC